MSAPDPQVLHEDEWPEAFDQRSGAKIRQFPAHGTYAGNQRHAKYRIPMCDPCRRAGVEYMRDLRRSKRMAAGKTTDTGRLAVLTVSLRALIEKWRTEAFEDARDAQATAIERCADELERAIGDGRG